ncbi:MAG: transposase [Hydrogenophaga sp.]
MEAVHSKSRRRHGTQFKQEVLAACDQPGASVAGVALAFGLNANLVRQWRRGRGYRPVGGDLVVPAASATPQAAPPFVALALPAAQAEAAADIRIEVRRGALAVNVSWPSTGAANCAAWLRELLR